MPGKDESRFRGGAEGVRGHCCHRLSPTRAFQQILPLAKDPGLLRACFGLKMNEARCYPLRTHRELAEAQGLWENEGGRDC